MSNLRDELKALLEKYDCSICFEFDDCTDTHGIYGECIEIIENKTDKVLISVSGYGLDAKDLNNV